MRDVNIDSVKYVAQSNSPSSGWLHRRDLEGLDPRRETGPVLYVIRNHHAGVVLANLGDRAVDRKTKGAAETLERRLLRRDRMPVLRTPYSNLKKAQNGVFDVLQKALAQDDRNIYFVGVDDHLFDAWRTELAQAPTPAETAPGFPSLALPELPPDETLERKFLGHHPDIVRARQMVLRACRVREPVLIIGEAGTGKDILARALHRLRGEEPLRHLTAGSLDPAAPDAALVGEFERTVRRRAEQDGRTVFHKRGTLFIDEISELPRRLQAVLSHTIESLSQAEPPFSDCAGIVATTTQNLQALAEAGRFDPHLHLGLHRIAIYAPPLRDHPDDIPLLAQTFWRQITGQKRAELEAPLLRRLQDQRWPGNVRDLKAVLSNLHILYGTAKPGLRQLDDVLLHWGRTVPQSARETGVVQRMDSLQFLRRVETIVQSCEPILQLLLSMRNRGRASHMLDWPIGEIAYLCGKPALFPSPAICTGLDQLRGHLTYINGIMGADLKIARRFFRTILTPALASLRKLLVDTMQQLAGGR